MVPLVAVDSPLRPRMLLCSSFTLRTLRGRMRGLGSRMDHQQGVAARTTSWVCGAILAAFVASCSISMIGVQRAYRERWLLDERIGANFRAAMPDPQPGTVFFVLNAQDRSLRTGNRHLDRHFFGTRVQLVVPDVPEVRVPPRGH